MKVLRIRDVMEITGLGRSTIYRLEDSDDESIRFPRRVQLSPARVGWKLDEVEAWISKRTTPTSAAAA